MTEHHPLEHFLDMYAARPDPWAIEDSWYERRKRSLLLAMLPHQRFGTAVEPGCGLGTLTEALAERCAQVRAFDPVPRCVAATRDRVGSHPHVVVEQGTLPTWWPEVTADLVVLSEVAYYLGAGAGQQLRDHLDRWLAPGGVVAAVHWTGPTNYPRSADACHDDLDRSGFLSRRCTYAEPWFIAGVWTRAPHPDLGPEQP